ncbi:MAG: endonuclease/exonuclease/phosphatase family protein [Myxococcota bacterium]|jgi:endonuclease/exonuclease/phosphatase family metal-dependent hydrolase|nr:endonuclease/exonuclease/phosphatase family protein [Myxococcota bacterium]
MNAITYNIRLGLESSLGAVGRLLTSLAPDLVGLQEVGAGWVMGPAGDQAAILAQGVGLPHHLFGPALRLSPTRRPWTPEDTGLPRRSLGFLATPGPLVRPVGPTPARFGVALLSRWPVTEITTFPLPRGEDEQRVLLAARVATPAGALRVGVTHLSTSARERLRQAEAVGHLVRALSPGPWLLLGDLNDTPDSPTLRVLQEAGLRPAGEAGREAEPSFPARNPLQRLDYILLGGPWDGSGCCRVIPAVASDHRPVVAELPLGL